MSKQRSKPTVKVNHPLPSKNGVKVYYDGETEAHLRSEAARRGFRNVQEMLKHDARKAREAAQGR